jgi:hypothetical protein
MVSAPVLTRRSVMLLTRPTTPAGGGDARRLSAVFLDRRTGQLALPAGRIGLDLGAFTHPQQVVVCDHMLVIKDGNTLVGYADAASARRGR